MSKLPYKIQIVQDELNKLSTLKNFEQAQRVILSVIKLLDDSISENDLNLFQLFNDSDGKIRANATWFFEDQVMADRKATYKVHSDNKLNIDFKVYGVNKASKRVVAWATALTPNFEDEPFNSKFSVGIDFIIPKSADRVIIVLTNNYVIRTLELKGNLTVTFQEILSKWSDIKEYSNKTLVHNILWESFDLQPLNKKFYAGISERFITLRQHLLKENILDEKHSSMFANRLLGRVIFTWFVDKKGIINPDLKYFDSQSFEDDSEYYRTKLERLFFGVLNTPTDEREYKDDITPFLNGGLFEVRQNDLYKNSKLTFPKNYFDDLFTFLSEYNFTTDESTSQFQQVAIDPEMLGRIFENLLAEITEETGEQARKAKGAFYTPREIVDYMCKESLKEYLKTKLPEDTYRDQRLYQLIDAPDKDFQDQDHNWRRDWKPYKDAIISALDDLKVLDPACGSGAFPIGMLQLLVRVYERLEPRFDGYKAKLQIIEKNIYGVDIEPMAVEISRLRTWLSIIVDEESDSKKIKPLPNLEFKFVCANSLIELDKSGATSFWDDSELENKLQVLRDAYFNTESLNKKKKLRSEYDDLVNKGPNMFGESEKSLQLKTYRPFDNESSASFFDSQFMFGVKQFEVIVGNPPYVDSEMMIKNNPALRNKISELYSTASGNWDLYIPFMELAHNLVTDKGIFSFITPNKWLSIKYGVEIRKKLQQNIFQIGNCNYVKVFEAGNTPVVFFCQKNVTHPDVKVCIFDQKYNFRKTTVVDSTSLKNENWGWLLSEQLNLVQKLSNNKKGSLYYKCSNPFSVSEAYLVKEILKDAENIENFSFENDFKFVNTGTIEPFYSLWGIKNTTYLKDKYYLPIIKKEDLKKLLPKRYEQSIVPKIIISGMRHFECYFDFEGNTVAGKTTVILKNKEDYNILFILGILNSKIISFYIKEVYSALGIGGGISFTPDLIESLPFPEFSKEDELKVINISKLIIESKKIDSTSNVNEKETELNEIVMNLYDLKEEEMEIIRNS